MKTYSRIRAGSIRNQAMNLIMGLAGILIFAGCSSSSPVELAGTEDEAKSALTAALDAWKAGQKPDNLRTKVPAVIVVDQDWQSGMALKAYQITGTPEEAGGQWRVAATITVSGDGSSDTEKNVSYTVTTDPAITVHRVDETINE